MSFKKELEKRQKSGDESRNSELAQAEQRHAKMVGRAAELEKHLTSKRVRSVGLDMAREGSRIVLKHDRYQIHIDVDVDHYEAAKLVLRQQGAFNLMTAIEKKRVTTMQEVDQFIIDVLDAQ